MARIAVGILFLLATPAAQAAFYDTKSFFISALLAHDVIDPEPLNRQFHADAPLRAFFSGRIRGERGLVAPFLSHWIEVGGGYAWSSGQGEITGLGLQNLDQSLMYFWAVPAGVTWWFLRTSYVDLGMGLGIGLGFAPQHTQTATEPTTGVVSQTLNSSGSVGFLIDGGIQGRLWISKYFGIDLAGGLRYFGAEMTSPSDAVMAHLYSINVTVGATFAFGGVRGTGRAQIDVIKPGKKPPPGAPVPAATPTPKAL